MGVMMTDEYVYTPERVAALLRRLPYLLDQHAKTEDAPRARRQRTSPAGWVEDQMAKRADIEQALWSLPETTYRIVYLSYVADMSLREVADICKVSHETVRRHKLAGVKRMARELGWQDAEDSPV